MDKRESLLAYCLDKQGAAEDFPFGPDPSVLKVAGKMFALLPFASDEETLTISLKCDPFIAEMLRMQYAAVTAGYHLNKKHWNTVRLDGTIPDPEVLEMIDQSYALIVRGLTKAERALLQG